MKRFLIIQTAFLGDVILMTPIVSELNRLYPIAKIDVLVRSGNESLLLNNPKINEVIVWQKKQKKYTHLFEILRKIRKSKYDEVIGVQRYASAGLLVGLSKSSSRVGFKNNPLSFLFTRKIIHQLAGGKHEVERNLSLIRHHEGVKTLVRPELFPSKENEEKVAGYQTSAYYCIAPASVWFTKQVSKEKWLELILHLGAEKIIYLLGSPSDFEINEAIKNLVSEGYSVINLAGKFNLLDTAALMKKAKRNYVNDSGPLHIASSVNAPVTVFFCSTIPAFGFGPLSDDAQIVEVQEKLACRPCGTHGFKSCSEGHFKCNVLLDMERALK